MKNIFHLLLVSIVVSFTLVGCAAKTPWYEGYYFDAKINNVPVVEIQNKSSIKALQRFSKFSNVKWMATGKAHGELDVKIRNNEKTRSFVGRVGSNDDLDVYIYALGNQNLNTEKTQTTSKNVLVNQASVSTEENMMKSNFLPAGPYVISVKTDGSDNWDRKYIYVEFE